MVGGAHPTKHCNPAASRSALLQTRRAFTLKLPSLLESGAVALWGLRNHLDRDSAAQ